MSTTDAEGPAPAAGPAVRPGTTPGAAADSMFAPAELAWALRPHQVQALAAFERDRASGDRATYLVIPPGGGKTLVGLEALRRLGRPAVVLCPNTAIQAQWIGQWHSAFAPATVTATASRELPSPLTVLTYQAVGAFTGNGDGKGPADRSARRPGGRELLAQLHPNGQALIERLRQGGPWTVVLDECHHLLEVWGRLLQTVLGQLTDPHVIGLTATPPHLMTADQAELHRALFGRVDLEISTPALVRDGVLAPYQELAYFTRPTPTEADYIHGETVRFAELRAGLLDPQFASTPFLTWLQTRVVERHGREGAQLSWQRFERDEPALADAAVRLHLAGLADLPEGAQVREQHRHPPTAEDWIALIGDYCRNCLLPSDDPRDASAYEAIRRALPAVGYRLTRAGVRAADSPVGPRTRRPPTAGFSALNAVMLQRPAARETARADWAVGTPYQDEPVATVTVSARRPLGLAGRAVVPVSRRHRTRPWQVAGLATAVSALVLLSAQPVADAAATSLVAAACGLAVSRTAVRIGRAGGSSCLADLAAATADALHTVGLTSQDASAVRVEVLPDGSYRARLQDVPAGEAATFSTALEEVLSPLAQPRYVIPRLIVAPPGGPERCSS